MKAVKIILNIFGILLSIVLSLVLLLTIVVSPVFTAASDIVKPETIHKVITNINYEQLLVDNGIDVENSMEEYGIPAQAITDIMESDMVGDVIELYAKEVEAALAGNMDTEFLNADAIKQIAGENIDEIVNIALQFIPEEEIPTDVSIEEVKEQVKVGITEYVETNAEEIVSYLPDVKEMIVESVDTQTIEVIRYVQNGTFTGIIWGIIIVLSAIIYLLRFPRFKGFMWLAVVYFLGAISTFALGSTLNGTLLDMIIESVPELNIVVTPAAEAVYASIIKVGIILMVLTALYIAAFVVGRVFLAKRKKALAAATDAPVGYYAVEAEVVTEETEVETSEQADETPAETVAETTEEIL